MPKLGEIFVLLSLVVATYTACAAIIGHRTKSERLLASSRHGVYAVFGLLSAASFILIYLFVVGDYSVKYVHHYSDRSMPLFYKATAMWGGQEGSLLFWVWVMSIWAAIATYQNRDRNKELMPYTIVTMMWVTLFFVTLLAFVVSPFETSLVQPPTDGRGLNPLLQNPYMVTHPPSLYLGYIGWTIPFCFAIGALAHGKLDYEWIRSMRRWCLVAWVCLSVGLTLGGLWAYEELGWGGYWAWDPVENAAFMPWLTGTAFIHSVQVQERRKIFKVWNMILIVITFVMTLLGTMMTRSGIVQSVHAFAQSDIGGYFLVFLVITLAVSIGLILYRSDQLRPENGLESILSREFAFLVNNWVLLAAAFFVTFATVFPAIYKWLTDRQINVGPAFFNLWMIPIGLILLGLTAVGPALSWRKSTGQTLKEQFTGPVIVTLLGSAGIWFITTRVYGRTSIYGLIALTLCLFSASMIVREFWVGTRARMRSANENPLDALMTLVSRARRRYGGYVVHFAVVLMFFGFAGEAFKVEQQSQMKKGETVTVGDKYGVRLDDLVFGDDGQKNTATAKLTVFKAGTDVVLGTLEPAKWSYRKPEEQMTTEVAKMMSLADDLYTVLAAYDGSAGTAVLQLKVNPLVNFVWLGCSFLMFGFMIAVWPEPTKAREPLMSKRTAKVAVGFATFVLSVISLVLAFA
ncbi:MAG: heme lyase CcmF/NrfE family subunit [Deltaproteobacteria bacterium]|nr:heme lyase CcmF/NrfE family subunit [Deltaproteobacteria bacterium]